MLISNTTLERKLFDDYASSVAYIVVEDREESSKLGTCFHVGNGIYITARHVVENLNVKKVATTNAGIRGNSHGGFSVVSPAKETVKIEQLYFHPDSRCDLAALRINNFWTPPIPLTPIIEDRFGNDYLMLNVVIMGFPPIPGAVGIASGGPVLVCAKAEINATCESYLNGQRYYVASCLARGGFSGGPALMPRGHCLGVVVQSMLADGVAAELGFMAILPTLQVAYAARPSLDHAGRTSAERFGYHTSNTSRAIIFEPKDRRASSCGLLSRTLFFKNSFVEVDLWVIPLHPPLPIPPIYHQWLKTGVRGVRK